MERFSGFADQDYRERHCGAEARNGSIGALCIKNVWLFTEAGQPGKGGSISGFTRAGRGCSVLRRKRRKPPTPRTPRLPCNLLAPAQPRPLRN